MEILTGVLVLLALALGAVVGWWLSNRNAQERLNAATQISQETTQQLGLTQQQLATTQEQLTERSETLGQVRSELAGEQAKSKILQEQNQRLVQQQATDGNVLKALEPVNEKLIAVQKHVSQLERDRVQQFGKLEQQLQDAKETDAQLLAKTQSLDAALRSNTARGQWGEAQLRRVVEAAGMLAHVDFEEQVHLSNTDGAQRPDMVINLPGEKTLVLDAKVPLTAYLDAYALEDTEAEQRQTLLQSHAKALQSHIDTLASKKYWEKAGNTPELVICYVPMESILSEAFRSDPSLLDRATTKGVILASPVSLLAILKAIAFTWQQDVLTENAKELFTLAKELYERMGTLGNRVTDLGRSLGSSVDKYNALIGTLEKRVLPSARKLSGMDPASLETQTPLESTPRKLTAPELAPDHLTPETNPRLASE